MYLCFNLNSYSAYYMYYNNVDTSILYYVQYTYVHFLCSVMRFIAHT